MEKYSVVVLKEGKIDKPLVTGDKIFEELILLCTLPEHFFEDATYPDILKYFREKMPPLTFQNAYGEMVSEEVIAVIDAFSPFSRIDFEEFAEVYSRHFTEPFETTLDDILNKYYSDFSFVKQKGSDPHV